MKRIKIETADKIYLAKPLTLSQLEESEDLLKSILDESKALQEAGATQQIPVGLLKKQAQLVLIGLKNHDSQVNGDDVSGFSAMEISQAMTKILSGSGLEEVKEGNAAPVA